MSLVMRRNLGLPMPRISHPVRDRPSATLKVAARAHIYLEVRKGMF